MNEYHKISSIYKRDEKKNFIIGDYSRPEFEYLKNNKWIGTEKVDGTNIRVMWFPESEEVKFGGKTDNAQIPSKLIERLINLFPREKFINIFPREGFVNEELEKKFGPPSVCLYGEGYGLKIQKMGSSYNPKGVDFVLFDIKIGGWWFKREDVIRNGDQLEVKVVPEVFSGTLDEAIEFTKKGFKSEWGDFKAEGLVLKPSVELKTRAGERIITKVKTVDFMVKEKKEKK